MNRSTTHTQSSSIENTNTPGRSTELKIKSATKEDLHELIYVLNLEVELNTLNYYTFNSIIGYFNYASRQMLFNLI